MIVVAVEGNMAQIVGQGAVERLVTLVVTNIRYIIVERT